MGINEIIQIGTQIKQKRIEKGLSQKEMASYLGIPVSTYSNYENNYREPKAEIIKKIADKLEISVKELLNNEDASRKFIKNYVLGEFENEFSGVLGAINLLMKSLGCFIEAQDDKYLIYNPHYEAFLVPKEEITWLESEMKDYLLFRIDKLYEKHYEEIGNE